jgi:translation initiation factor IF-2
MRVYEVAKEFGIPNKDLLAKIRALGLEVNNHMSSLDADAYARIKRSIEKERTATTTTTEIKPTASGAVLRRRSNKPDEVGPGPSPTPTPSHSAPPPMVRRRVVEDHPTPAPVAPPPVRPTPVVHTPPVAPPAPVHVAHEDTPPIRPRQVAQPVAAAPVPEVEPVIVRTPEAQPEVEPARPAQTATAPEPARQPEPRPAPVTPPQAREPEPAPRPAPVAVAPTPAPVRTPEPPAPAPRSKVIINAPAVMARQPARQTSNPIVEHRRESAPTTPPIRPQPTVIVRQRDPERPQQQPMPVPTVQDFTDTARSRFEAELERARARVAERQPDPVVVAPPAPVAVVEPAPRDPSRPAVGSIISLPTRIKITERTPLGGRPAPAGVGPSPIRGRFAQQQQRPGGGGPGGKGPPGRDFGRKKLPLGKKGKQTTITTPADHKRVIRIEDTISIADLARNMGVKATDVLKKLWGMGMTGVNINASIDLETSQILAGEFGYEVQNVAFKEQDIFAENVDNDTNLVSRSPVVTVMGHVDHGKTSLLDAIRKTRVAAGESGGITQHVAAYKVAVPGHGHIVFLDTPGHEAFTEMRARGAQSTDIVVLVVSATDGVMPQTVEALNHAKDAKVTIIVAVNKIDLPDAAPERIRQQLADHGLIPEEWGGETMYVNVSALRGENIDKLLEGIAVTAEVKELKANPDKRATGVVVEARLDRNRGPMATVLVQEGTLRVGDIVVAGRTTGKVRALLDDRGQNIKEAGPSTPVEVLGLDGVPEAGDSVNVAEDDKSANEVVEHRRQSWRKRELGTTAKVSLENIMERIAEGQAKEMKIVLKTDVQGSAEAIKAALVKLSGEKVKVNVISAGVGGITESDVNLAKAGNAIIVGFHVRPAGRSSKLAEQEGVQIRLYDIIYDALDEVRTAMAGLLAPIKREVPMGRLEVRDTFNIPKMGTVAGCMVQDGKITRKALLRVFRESIQVYEGKVGSLRRFKDDVSEVGVGYECGVMIAGYNDLKAADIIECFEVVEEAAKL